MCANSPRNFCQHDKPRYLMGVGTPLDILEAVHRGVDMFDCIMPTQLAQRGAVFTSRGFFQMRRGVYKFSEEKLDPACACPTCARYSRAYLHHLTKTSETLGWQLLGKHNIHFYHQLMREIRESILADRFLDLYREKRAFLHESDLDNPIRDAETEADETPLTLGKLRSPYRAGGFCQHPPDFVRRDHAFAHAADGRGAADFTSSNRISPSACGFPRTKIRNAPRPGHLGCRARRGGECDGGDPLLRRAGGAAVRSVRCRSSASKTISIRSGSPSGTTDDFPYLRHGGPAGILEDGAWQSRQHPGLELVALPGDFLETMAAAPAPPDLIFYDMFSSKTSGDQWTLECFRSLFAACAGRAGGAFHLHLLDRHPRRASRRRFLCREGTQRRRERETTIALTPAAWRSCAHPAHDLLSADWLKRWHRSAAKFPAEIQTHEHDSFEQAIRAHEQFQSS